MNTSILAPKRFTLPMLSTIGTTAVSDHFYWRFPLAAMATYDKPRDLESAKTLQALAPTLLAVGHGRPVVAPAAAIDAAIRHAGR